MPTFKIDGREIPFEKGETVIQAAQRAGIDSVMQRTDSSLRAIRAQMQPEIQKVFERSRVEMESRLDATQRVKFDSGMARRRRP